MDLLQTLASFVATSARRRHEEFIRTIQSLSSYSESEALAATAGVANIYNQLSGHLASIISLREQFGDRQGVIDAKGRKSLDAVLNHLFEAVPTMLASIETQTQAQAQLALGAQTSAARIQSLARETQTISESTQLLAINARIEAAHAGPAGKGFGVVANTLKDLSTVVRQTNQAIWELGSSVGDTLARLAEATTQLVASSRTHSGLEDDLASGRDAYAATQQEIRRALGDLAQHSESIRAGTNRVMVCLQFEDRLRQNLNLLSQRSETQVQVLEQLAKQILDRTSPVGEQELSTFLASASAVLERRADLASVDMGAGQPPHDGQVEIF